MANVNLPTPVVMVSSATGPGSEQRDEALRRGAVACFGKNHIISASGMLARLVKDARDRDFVEHNGEGLTVNHLKSVASLGGATLDNEENYLIKKLFTGGLGILPIENQARL